MMSRDEFIQALEAKVERATQGWPDWKHQVLQNSFRATNSAPRQIVVKKTDSSTPESLGTSNSLKED